MTTNSLEEYSKQYNVLMSSSYSLGHDSSKAKQSNISTISSLRPGQIDRPTCTSSDLSFETSYDGSTTSSSSVSSLTTRESNSSPGAGQPGYMTLTTSIKAKQRASPRRARSTHLQPSDNRAKKPWFRLRLRLLGWYVRFGSKSIGSLSVASFPSGRKNSREARPRGYKNASEESFFKESPLFAGKCNMDWALGCKWL